MTADRSSMHRARAACVLLALGAPRAAARDRLCNLWQVIDQDSSKFTHVSGVLNDKYSLNLKGSWHPHISGKMLQSFEGRCPSRLSQLEGRSFTLSSSSAEPIFLTYSEVKAGPATIRVSQLQAQMLPASFTISDDACEGDLEGASFCFAGQARLVALSGTAHALGHDFDLTGANGTFHIAGYIEPDELRLGLQLTQVSADFAVATAEVHGPFKLAGHISSAAELPYTFDLGLRSEAAARGVTAGARGAIGRALGAAALGACAMALVAAVRSRRAGGGTQLLGARASDEEAAAGAAGAQAARASSGAAAEAEAARAQATAAAAAAAADAEASTAML